MQAAAAVVVIIALLVAAVLWLNRPRTRTVDVPVAAGFHEDGFSHEQFEAVLKRYVDSSGNVDYEALHASPDALATLESYLAAVSAWSPDSAPQRFPTRNDELAYWMYAYNACVMHSIASNWPIERVTDVKAPLEAVEGLGFFYRNRYLFGGKAYSLHALENDIIRERYRDPRIHFVLNCGSESCPVLRRELPTGAALETLLDDATADFINDLGNVAIDHENGAIALSEIFSMYEEDFLNALKARGLPAPHGIIDYLIAVADEPLRSELQRAADYDIYFDRLNWRINAVSNEQQSQPCA